LKRLGHDVLGLDTGEHALYGELTELFGVPRIVWRIKPFEPLPDLGRRFDWITAFSIAFDTVQDGEERWGPSEWNFLLEDLRDRHWLREARCFLRSIRARLAPTTRRSYANSSLRVAQQWSVNGFSSPMGCDNARW
jgi:hypothetical protein